MYRFSTFPEPGAAEDSGAADVATAALPSVPDLPPPQALITKAHPSARIAVRRKLNIKQIPFVLLPLYIAAGAPGTGLGVQTGSWAGGRRRCGVKRSAEDARAPRS